MTILIDARPADPAKTEKLGATTLPNVGDDAVPQGVSAFERQHPSSGDSDVPEPKTAAYLASALRSGDRLEALAGLVMGLH